MNTPKNVSDKLLLLAFVFSGFAALGYELLWTRLLSLSLGGESLGILGVLAGFFGGMVLGAFYFDKRIVKSQSPIRLFIIMEVVVAGYAIFSPQLLYWLAKVIPPLVGPLAGDNHSIVALFTSIIVAGIILLPGTFFMGGTFAALVEARKRIHASDSDGKGLGRLYAANTLGATLGVFITTYFILPSFGLALGAVILCGFGLLSIAVAFAWNKQNPLALISENQTASLNDKKKDKKVEESIQININWTYTLLFATGLAAVGLEITTIQIVSQILENTIYTFANMLAVYLLGTSIGAWGYQYIIQKYKTNSHQLTLKLLLAMSISAWFTALLLKKTPAILTHYAPSGASYATHLYSEIVIAFVLFLIPTIFMGALFSHIISTISKHGVGKAYAINTLGSTVAPFIFGLFGIEILGYRFTLLLVIVIYFFIFIVHAFITKSTFKWKSIGVGMLLLTMFSFPKSMDLIEKTEGHTINKRKEGLMGVVIVSENNQNGNLHSLQVNKNFRMGGQDGFADKRAGHLSMLSFMNPKKVVFLGIGTAVTLSSVKQYNIEHVDAVEIVPAVLDVLPYFNSVNNEIYTNKNIHFHTADARRFMAASKEKYDIIFADLYHPGVNGTGLLYSKDNYETLKNHLTENGVVTQWVPLYQFDIKNLKSLIRGFLEVFPEVHSFIGLYNANTPMLMLMGKQKSKGTNSFFNLDYLDKQIRDSTEAYVYIKGIPDYAASYFVDKKGLEQFSAGAELNTDLNPRILFDVPRVSYSRSDSVRYSCLQAMLPYRHFPAEYFKDHAALLNESKNAWTSLGNYLLGEIDFVKNNTITNFALDHWLMAYEVDTNFSAAKGKLLYTAAKYPLLRSQIEPKLTPNDRTRINEFMNMP